MTKTAISQNPNLGVAPPDRTCEQCGLVFSEIRNLIAHQRVHSGDRPYRCLRGGCGKAFKWKSSLSAHQRSHRREEDKQIKKAYQIAEKLQREGCPGLGMEFSGFPGVDAGENITLQKNPGTLDFDGAIANLDHQLL